MNTPIPSHSRINPAGLAVGVGAALCVSNGLGSGVALAVALGFRWRPRG